MGQRYEVRSHTVRHELKLPEGGRHTDTTVLSPRASRSSVIAAPFRSTAKRTPGGINGISVVIILGGGLLLYSGVKGIPFSTSVRDLLSGKNPSADAPSAATGAGGASIPSASGSGGAKGDPATNRLQAQALAATRGWTGPQWTALQHLWDGESGFDNTALNPSGAFGIAQALPSSKYPKAGQPVTAGGRADPGTQIRWGLTYIRQRYGNPVNAYSAWLSRNPHWY